MIDRNLIVQDIADILYTSPEVLNMEDDLSDHGMDSVRIMELVEKWRSSGVANLEFYLLAENKNLSHWIDVIERLQSE